MEMRKAELTLVPVNLPQVDFSDRETYEQTLYPGHKSVNIILDLEQVKHRSNITNNYTQMKKHLV